MENKPHFSSHGLEFKEKVSITSLGTEMLLRDICQVPRFIALQLDSGSVVTSCGGTEHGWIQGRALDQGHLKPQPRHKYLSYKNEGDIDLLILPFTKMYQIVNQTSLYLL